MNYELAEAITSKLHTVATCLAKNIFDQHGTQLSLGIEFDVLYSPFLGIYFHKDLANVYRLAMGQKGKILMLDGNHMIAECEVARSLDVVTVSNRISAILRISDIEHLYKKYLKNQVQRH